jgi:hypothetical protein
MTFVAGFVVGCFAMLIGELLLGLAIWLCLTRRRDDAPEEAD